MQVPEFTPGEAASMLDAGAIGIDVREPHEWAHARIDGTELLPLQQAIADVPRRFPDRDATIVVICHSGARSGWLVAQLVAGGWRDVHNLGGGIVAWAADGRPVLTD